MGKFSAFVLVFIGGITLGVLTAPRLTAQLRTGNAKQLLKTDLSGCAGKEVTVTLNEIGPGTSGPHYHPADSFTYILEGSEVYQIEGQPKVVVKAGDVLHEKPKQVHTVDNTGPVKLLVVRVAEKGQPETVRVNSKP
jgi:quercetin dioxygenase-like cupin family protein